MISVCMALYNGEKFLRKQAESVLCELSAEDELVVSDDLSTDGSLTLLRSFGDARLRILENSRRLGPVYNAARALQAARGDFIFLCDQDDVWLPGKVKACMQALASADLVLHDACILNGGKRETETLFQKRKVRRGLWQNILRNSYTGCCMAFRRPVLERALPFPPKLPMHDQWIGLLAEKEFRVEFLPEPLIEYRIHGGNFTQMLSGSRHSFRKKLLWRLGLIKNLFRE